MLNEKKSAFHVVMSHWFSSGGHLEGEGAVIHTAQHKKIRMIKSDFTLGLL